MSLKSEFPYGKVVSFRIGELSAQSVDNCTVQQPRMCSNGASITDTAEASAQKPPNRPTKRLTRMYLKSLKKNYKRQKAAYLRTHTLDEFRSLQAEVRREEGIASSSVKQYSLWPCAQLPLSQSNTSKRESPIDSTVQDVGGCFQSASCRAVHKRAMLSREL